MLLPTVLLVLSLRPSIESPARSKSAYVVTHSEPMNTGIRENICMHAHLVACTRPSFHGPVIAVTAR